MRRPSLAIALVLCCTACGTSSSGPDAAGPSRSASSPVKAGALVLVRTGGIAGVRDRLRVASDGRGSLTTRTGGTRHCTPRASGVARLRQVDLGAVAAQPSRPPRIADGYSYTVTYGGRTATGSEGDDGRRAELVDAAAVVLRTCLADRPAGY